MGAPQRGIRPEERVGEAAAEREEVIMTLMRSQGTRGRRAVAAELDLSVIIPAYNEERRLPRSIETIIRYLDQQPIKYEIAVVDDGSSDGTREIVRRFAIDHPGVVLL